MEDEPLPFLNSAKNGHATKIKPHKIQLDSAEIYLFIGLGVVGCVLILLATRWGAALRDDSYYYIQPAREILAGKSFFLNPHYPPFLPLLLTVISLFGSDPLDSLRILNAGLFAANIILSGVIVRRITGSAGWGLAAAGLVLVSPVTAEVHAWGMSEPLYFTLALLSFYGLGRYFDAPSVKWLLLAGVLAGLAFWTRYAGIALLAAGLLTLLINPRLGLARRLAGCAVYGILGSVPVLLYALRNVNLTGQPVNYQGFEWAPLTGKALAEALYTGLLWFMPGRLARGREEAAALVLIAAGLALVIAYYFLRRRSFTAVLAKVRDAPSFFLLLFFMATNFAVLYAAHYAVAYKSPFDMRLTSPIHLGMLLALPCLFAWVWQQNGQIVRTAVSLALFLLILLYAPRTIEMTRSFYQVGSGFATRYWRQSETITFIKQHPDLSIISTAPYGVYFWANRLTDVVSTHNSGAAVEEYLRRTGGVLIVFNTMPLEMYGIDEKEYLRGLQKMTELDDSTIYQVK
jgi:4-amino-4-deoxy-L-arabinose transferase-like glycosyltransferase